ncbi:MAG TPA: prenyltransferase/squalene oxidase repeat-containing protein [Streptosporangiaceae bacterium]
MPSPMPTRLARRGGVALLAAVAAVVVVFSSGPGALAGSPPRPDQAAGSAYLTGPARLIDGHYYRTFSRAADFGLTLDGALALAATGDQDRALRKIVAFLARDGRDATGKTVSDWTGIGTRYASGGAIGKEALLAEVVGASPRDFGGRNLLAALAASVCPRAGAGGMARCPAAGSYAYASSVFDQALGVLAQLRAGPDRQAAAPVRYLESLRHSDGSFPSLIPGTDGDVDSTAIAVMALALAPGAAAAADVGSGLAWIASRQRPDGGFPGVGGESVNSTGLAIQALALRRLAYRARIAAAEKFLAREQNADGGFRLAAGRGPASDLRASAQAVSGAAAIPFGSLRRPLDRRAAGQTAAAGHPARGSGGWIVYLIVIAVVAMAAAVVTVMLRRRRRRKPVAAPVSRADPVGRPHR